MTQLELDYDEPPDEAPAWTPPATTRWCLVGTPGQRLTVLSEHLADAPACPLEQPDRGNYLSPDPAAHPPAWLSPHGVGTTPTHGGGIAGYAWFLTMEADRARAQRARPRGKK